MADRKKGKRGAKDAKGAGPDPGPKSAKAAAKTLRRLEKDHAKATKRRDEAQSVLDQVAARLVAVREVAAEAAHAVTSVVARVASKGATATKSPRGTKRAATAKPVAAKPVAPAKAPGRTSATSKTRRVAARPRRTKRGGTGS